METAHVHGLYTAQESKGSCPVVLWDGAQLEVAAVSCPTEKTEPQAMAT